MNRLTTQRSKWSIGTFSILLDEPIDIQSKPDERIEVARITIGLH